MAHLPFEHYRKTHICRVPPASARTRALGKAPLCRVPKAQHSANTRHSARPTFAKYRPSAKKGHSASFIFAECRWARTRQRPRMCPARAPAVRRPSVGLTALSIFRVPPPGTRQRGNVAECVGLALGIVSFTECWSPGTRQTWLKKIFLGLQIFLVST